MTPHPDGWKLWKSKEMIITKIYRISAKRGA